MPLPFACASQDVESIRQHMSRTSETNRAITLVGRRTMKIRLLLILVGLAISFALPTFAQQTNAPDPQLREALATLL